MNNTPTPLLNGAAHPQPHPILDAGHMSLLNSERMIAERRLRNWQLTTWYTLALATVLVAAVVILSLARREHYYSVTVDQTGASFVAEAPVSEAHSAIVVQLVLESFVMGIRSVVADQHYQVLITNRAFFLCRTGAQAYIRAQMELEKPEDLQKRGVSRMPRDIEVVQQSENTFAVSWVEDQQDATGNKATKWSAVLVTELKNPADLSSDERKKSPNGIFINAVQWSSHGSK